MLSRPLTMDALGFGHRKVEKRATSLYLAPGALRTLKVMAAEDGVRPHRVLDAALRGYFASRGFDFDTLNNQE